MAEPVNGIAYTFFISLVDSSDPTSYLASPTIASGDFQVSTDGGTFANLTTLPSVLPTGSISVLITVSASEMTGDKVVVKGIDVSGAEWEDVVIFIDVPASTSETAVDILEGDHVETNLSLIINKKGTSTAVLSKTIKGSLLVDGVVIQTNEA